MQAVLQKPKFFISHIPAIKLFQTGILYLKEPRLPPNITLKEKKWQLEFYQKEKGVIYDRKPCKVKLVKGNTYRWCVCGYSKHQPFCDFTHHIQQLKIKLRPIVFKAPETVEIWLCNCKQTKNRPFCDGSHRSDYVQNS